MVCFAYPDWPGRHHKTRCTQACHVSFAFNFFDVAQYMLACKLYQKVVLIDHNRMNYKLLPVLFLFVLASCGGDSRTKGSKQSKPAEAETPARQSTEGIDKLNLYMETSASMSGFLVGDTEFKATVSRLVAALERSDTRKFVQETFYQIIPEGTRTDTIKNADRFQDILTNPALARGRSSEIIDILRMIHQQHEPGTVDIFVSDFILSDFKMADKDIIQSRVAMLFNQFASSGKAVAIHAFTSQFNGNTIKQQNRPYYIWLMGDSQAIEALQQQFRQNNITPAQEMYFGFWYGQTPNYQLLNSTNKKGEGTFLPADNNKSLNISRMYKGKPIQMAMGLNLNAYPARITDPSYLRKHLVWKNGPNVEGEIISIEPRQGIRLQGRDSQRADEQELTHFVTFELQAVNNNQSHFELVLQKAEPGQWYEDWTTMESNKPQQTENKTFAFSYLVNGLRSAYRTIENEPYFTVRVPVKK